MNESADLQKTIRLIVNGDDFGYFDEISRGIVASIDAKVVTATGVMANGPALRRWVDALRFDDGREHGSASERHAGPTTDRSDE